MRLLQILAGLSLLLLLLASAASLRAQLEIPHFSTDDRSALPAALRAAPLTEHRAGTPSVDSERRSRKVADVLSRKHAELRARMVSDVTYELEVDVTKAEEYAGQVEIGMSFEPRGQPLTFDFSGGEIDRLAINGREIAADYNGFFLSIPQSELRRGRNRVEIHYRHPYSSDGTGLYRFVDPEDEQVYLYTYLWPYYANRLFPCFDQPDLKASYRLAVRAPADWVVVSTTGESSVEPVAGSDGDHSIWRFRQSAPVSTYVYSLIAGPYRIWESTADDIPMRLLARRSIAAYVDVEEWFGFTRQGFEFYERYFAVPYPFGKYDQILVPDFNIGAMENVAAVTFQEGYLWRSAPTRDQREALGGVILHEMAHMWFGNLVTKQWWNDLWLNESFATLLATLAKVDATEFTDGWHSFYLAAKRSAYQADGLVTTHPIEVPIPDTSSFFAVFDSITYGKGASVLKQLAHLVGEETFRAGVSSYLKQHAYANTRLEDFTRAIAVAAGRDLDEWSQDWLFRGGFNTIAVDLRCTAGEIAQLTLEQSAGEAQPTLREHRLELALLGPTQAGALGPTSIESVTVAGPSTELRAVLGRPCPTIVDPNHGDWGYAKIDLDPASRKSLETQIGRLEDPLTRSRMWGALWDDVEGGELSLVDFTQIVADSIESEDDHRVLRQVLGYLQSALEYLLRRQPASTAALRLLGPQIEAMLWRQTELAPPGSDRQMIWFDRFVETAHTAEALERLTDLLEGRLSIGHRSPDQDRRWRMLLQLSGWGNPAAPDLLRAEMARDSSHAGELWAIAVSVAAPADEVKEKWLAVFQDPGGELSFGRQRAAMSALFPAPQGEIQRRFLQRILEPLPQMVRARDPYFLDSYVRDLLAVSCDPVSVSGMSALLDGETPLGATARRALLEARQEAQGCQAVQIGMPGS